jgi:hypothetical protein
MEIYISINGVLRNLIQKFNYHYNDAYIMASNIDDDDIFEYGVTEPIQNDNLLESYKFQSKQQFEYFLYIEYVLEIFGHAGLSQENVISTLNKLIAENKEHNFTLIGLDEFGKAKPATLFFLSKNGFMGDNIKFVKSVDIDDLWSKCDYWVTDDKQVIEKCPKGKTVVKYNTQFNQHFTNYKEISKLQEINETWLISLENNTTLISTESSTNVK